MVNAEETAKAVTKVAECFKDGFHFADILTGVRTAVEIAERFTGLPGAEKKAFVIEVFKKAYAEVNPNIPWIPEPFETWIENYVIGNLIPATIELIISVSKGEVKVNSEGKG